MLAYVALFSIYIKSLLYGMKFQQYNRFVSKSEEQRAICSMYVTCSFLGPKWHSPIGSMPFHKTQKTLDFQGPSPSHFPS
jgi:hypothetical protein